MPEYNVLIVDDSPFMRKVFSDVIRADASFNVLATAGNGMEAVELALKLKPDIITMDVEMPQMNGIEALRRIMSVRPTPVIMLSAVTDNGTRDTIKALQYGAFDFIRKPDGAVKLDIRQVGELLLEKLHIAVQTVSNGAFRMLPAVEEKAEPPPVPEPRIPKQEPPVKSAAPPDAVIPEKKKEEPKSQLPRDRANPARVVEPPKRPSPSNDMRKADPPPIKPEPGLAKPASSAAGAVQEQRTLTERKRTTALSNKKPEVPNAPPAAEAPVAPSRPQAVRREASTDFNHIVVIGTSTGGPRALHEVLTGIPEQFAAPILIVQHMPPKFTHSLAQRLDSFCSIHVREASDGEIVESATAYIAPGGKHMLLVKDAKGTYRIKLTEDPSVSGHRPSVDVLFESAAQHAGLKRHAVLMTGMGSDGAKGMKALQASGALTTIAEAEETCVVYGMPRSAVELGAASHVLPLQSISSVLVREVNARKT
ncbi:protein-glutamate methylesterase/protein-glutamine glutaminase [Cohnella panacarvi]|uniref:protein-glutamate methylesterase/protein-glutamine glutaminase n=1 Tax=Cohnella panacarvi TaxID=400776 RepID=UPI00047B89C9|nr:chemotaxis response regulator protein-glutamate methylesterase [Cohnella panacarvi]